MSIDAIWMTWELMKAFARPFAPVDLVGSVSPEIHEVVVAFTLASRLAAGHIMLCGYNVDSKPGSGKTYTVGFGAQCIVYDRVGAVAVLKAMAGGKP